MILDWDLIFDIFRNVAVIIASIVAIYGINSWRRETKWKRKYELAEEVLASLYESHHAIKVIRSPLGFSNEGSSRTKKENETPKETEIFNQAYVSRERFERNREPLEKLHTLKYRFIALHGKQHEEHFDKFHKTMNDIFFAADEIAMVKLGRYGNDRELVEKIIKESRATLYDRIRGDDEIEKELQEAIRCIENECRSIIGKK